MFEPDRLDEGAIACLRYEDEIRNGTLRIPGAFLSVSFSGLVHPVHPRIDAILAQPGVASYPQGLLVPLLTPGPMDASIVLVEQSGPVSTILQHLGRGDLPSVALLLKGSMQHEANIRIQGSSFCCLTNFDTMSLVVIPPGDKRNLIVFRNSVLLIASTGPVGIDDTDVDLYLTRLLGHFQLKEHWFSPSTWRRLRRTDSDGNAITLRRHKTPGTLISPGGVITIAMHTPDESPSEMFSPDICLVHPMHTRPDLSVPLSLDVNLI